MIWDAETGEEMNNSDSSVNDGHIFDIFTFYSTTTTTTTTTLKY